MSEFVGACCAKIEQVTNTLADPVLMVNNDNRDQTPDFDKQDIWKILVGGAKLSRGYTVEGLTVSYYRRKTAQADTLMQMGRWFGFRKGYRDLVRLYIGTKEPAGKKKTVNLYEAFGSICRDEEQFRKELQRYASMDEPRITPQQIPPLVPSHMLRPTAANKMHNAVVAYRTFAGELSESTWVPKDPDHIQDNFRSTDTLFQKAAMGLTTFQSTIESVPKRGSGYRFFVGSVSNSDFADWLARYKWPGERRQVLEHEYMTGKHGFDPEIDNWMLLAPVVEGATNVVTVGGCDVRVVKRAFDSDDSRFTTYNEPRHRQFAEYILGKKSNPESWTNRVLDEPSGCDQGCRAVGVRLDPDGRA